ncbi:LytTR family DNA-binding domain-containing protein [Flavobacterium branchiophilum]|uniref:Two-component system response regulatory protein, LytTR family n=1 Tax=Flavobacterium branchiophilum (strain FL-15) TaxID=1034807 RepID=G2Z4Y8_FLABF|nr:LytTR family DNA-binding domain-containing protein [Flavobacterium branchiophilum]CCB70705.1 Two-component system response regulatory protein, LytTR family [Flavobacterium branchiophilum FL-15]
MNSLKAILVDDDFKSNEHLKILLSNFFPKIELVAETLTILEAKKEIIERKPNILFFGLINEENAIEDIKKAIDFNDIHLIVFSYEKKHAYDFYLHDAADFILKPLLIEQLIRSINKVEKSITRAFMNDANLYSNSINYSKPIEFIAISTLDKIEFFKLDKIIFCEAEGKYTRFYFEDGQKILSSKNIGEYEKNLDKNIFFRTHNTFIVNINKVKYINKKEGYCCEMINNITIPIAKRRIDEFNKFIRIKE